MTACGGEWTWHSYLSLLYSTVCELIVLIIILKLMKCTPGSVPGHTTIFELALLIGPICNDVVRALIYLKFFVCSFVLSFIVFMD